MKQTRRWIITSILALLVIGGIVAFRMWNKPHPQAENQQAQSITAQELFDAYSTNEQDANKRFLNQWLSVSGPVAMTETNQDGQQVIVLQTDDPLSGVMCTLRDPEARAPQSGQVTIKGRCTGFAGDVRLTDCILTP